MKVIIVGGVAGGATAAARIRRLNEHAEITVFERSGYISYANCGLPYYIGDVITDPEELTLQTPESFFKRFRINMKIHHEVISIHPERKTVSVKNLENGEIFEEKYDKLILSPGAKPTQPRLPGVGIDKLFTLRTVEDTFRIKEYINKNHPKSAVLAGGGFIGLELAENLRELGMDVTIVQRPKELKNMTSININKEKFGQLIHKEKPVLVDFWAPWCGYCRRIGAAYEKISEEYSDILIAGKVNIDEEPQIAEAEKIEIIPTLVLYRDGKAIDSIVAPESKIMIENFINEALEK